MFWITRSTGIIPPHRRNVEDFVQAGQALSAFTRREQVVPGSRKIPDRHAAGHSLEVHVRVNAARAHLLVMPARRREAKPREAAGVGT